MGHFNHRLSSKRGRESLDSEARRSGQDDTRANFADGLSSRRTSAPCDTATQVSSLELRGFIQLNNRQMPAAGQVRQGQSGQGYGADSRRTDSTVPMLGKRQGRNGLFGHESPLQES